DLNNAEPPAHASLSSPKNRFKPVHSSTGLVIILAPFAQHGLPWESCVSLNSIRSLSWTSCGPCRVAMWLIWTKTALEVRSSQRTKPKARTAFQCRIFPNISDSLSFHGRKAAGPSARRFPLWLHAPHGWRTFQGENAPHDTSGCHGRVQSCVAP